MRTPRARGGGARRRAARLLRLPPRRGGRRAPRRARRAGHRPGARGRERAARGARAAARNEDWRPHGPPGYTGPERPRPRGRRHAAPRGAPFGAGPARRHPLHRRHAAADPRGLRARGGGQAAHRRGGRRDRDLPPRPRRARARGDARGVPGAARRPRTGGRPVARPLAAHARGRRPVRARHGRARNRKEPPRARAARPADERPPHLPRGPLLARHAQQRALPGRRSALARARAGLRRLAREHHGRARRPARAARARAGRGDAALLAALLPPRRRALRPARRLAPEAEGFDPGGHRLAARRDGRGAAPPPAGRGLALGRPYDARAARSARPRSALHVHVPVAHRPARVHACLPDDGHAPAPAQPAGPGADRGAGR